MLNSIKRKNKLYKQYLKHPCSITQSRYKLYRNKLTHLLRAAEKSYVKSYLEGYKGNLRKTWKLINGLLCKNEIKTLHQKIWIGHCESDNNEDISNYFEEYFVNVVPKIKSSIEKAHNLL